MNNRYRIDRLIRKAQTRNDEERDERRNQQIFDNDMKEREFKLKERTAKQGQKKAKSDAIHARGDAAISFLDRQNDAFEVNAGRKSPEYFNMKYGGGGASGGGSGGGLQNPRTAHMGGLSKEDNKKISDDWNEMQAAAQIPPSATDKDKPMKYEDYYAQQEGRYLQGQQDQTSQMSAQEYNRKNYERENDIEKDLRSDQYNDIAVGFKGYGGGPALDARGATLERNDKGEMFGRMADGSEAALYFSDNQNQGVDASVYGGGPSISGNQRFGGMADVENFTKTGQQPTRDFERDMGRFQEPAVAPSANVLPTDSGAPGKTGTVNTANGFGADGFPTESTLKNRERLLSTSTPKQRTGFPRRAGADNSRPDVTEAIKQNPTMEAAYERYKRNSARRNRNWTDFWETTGKWLNPEGKKGYYQKR